MEENKGFKMKGASLYGKLNLNRGGYENMPDGRSKSSAFQKHEPGHNDSKNKSPKRNIKAEELVGEIGDKIDFLTEDYETHGTISKADYEAQMKVLRAKEQAAIDANKPK